MSKTKKILAAVVFFIVIMGAFTAYVVFFAQAETEVKAPIDETKLTTEEIGTVVVSNRYSYNYDEVTTDMMDDVKEIMAVDGQYIWIEDEAQRDSAYYMNHKDAFGDTSCVLYKTTDSYIQNKINEYNKMSTEYYAEFHGTDRYSPIPIVDIEDIKSLPVIAIERLTKKQSSTKERIAWRSNNLDNANGILAFNDMYMYDGDYLNENSYEFFKDNGLSLDCKNVKLEKLAAGNNTLITAEYFAVISADVKCKTNSGTFKDLAWVPAEGETNRVEFIMIYEANTQLNHKVCYICDLDVLNYEPVK